MQTYPTPLELHAQFPRFWSKVNFPDDLTQCWLWQGGTNNSGYGSISIKGILSGTHRVSYELLVGPIPDGLVIDHLCRTRLCVNPNDMELVTKGENVLRGDSFAARNARKAYCIHGHPFNKINTHYLFTREGTTRRVCRACGRKRSKSHYQRRKQLKLPHQSNPADDLSRRIYSR